MSPPQTSAKSQHPQAREAYERGVSLMDRGEHGTASRAFSQALGLDPAHALSHYQLGNCLRMTGDPLGAEKALKEAIHRDGALGDAYISLAYLYRQLGRGEEAAATLLALTTAHPRDTTLQLQVAGLLADMDQPLKAASIYEAILRVSPHLARTHLQLGLTYQKIGRFKEAEQALLMAIHCDPNIDAAYLRLAHTRRWQATDAPLLERLEATLTQRDLSKDTQVCLRFALGKMHDDLQHYDQAFAHFRAANDLYRDGLNFDRGSLEGYVSRIKSICVPSLFERKPRAAKPGPAPIFVVGMLRSGTTLVERILASHPEVRGLGETEMVDGLAGQLVAITGLEYPACLKKLDPRMAEDLAAEFRAGWPVEIRSASRVVDKNPLNFLHLGLIALVFPEARIVHCVRDPLDTCLSVYFQHFAHARNNYAYALEDIGFFYTQYADLMNHWRAVLPMGLHEVRYETLVEETEATSRALVTATGLDWHPDCMKPHEHVAGIATASLWQARQPVNRDSVGRWHHYAEHLEGLRRSLPAT